MLQQKETVEIPGRHTEERGLEELDTHVTHKRGRGKQRGTYLRSLSKWITEKGLEKILRGQTLLSDTKDRKL